MQLFKVVLLAILQGVAEFLPISSSGHLVIGQRLLGFGESGLRLEVFLHLGTLVAVVLFYRKTVTRLLGGMFASGERAREAWRYLGLLVFSAVPAGIVGIRFLKELEAAFSSLSAVGVALVFTGIVLTATRWLPRGEQRVGLAGALMMGVAQAIAILPGVSRSGMTLIASRAQRIDPERAAEFSFLMSAPPIAGAALLEVMSTLRGAEGAAAEVSWALAAIGGAVAAVVGYYSLKLLLKSLKSDKFWLFGPYCLLIGVFSLLAA